MSQGGWEQPGAQQGYAQPQGYPQPPQQPQQQSYPQQQAQGFAQANAGYAQQPYRGGPAGGAAVTDRGFFGSLFDFSFSSFVTPKVIKVLYALQIIMCALVTLAFMYNQFERANRMSMYSYGSSTEAYLSMLFAPVGFCVAVLFSRIMLEVTIVLFRIAENLGEINRKTREPQ